MTGSPDQLAALHQKMKLMADYNRTHRMDAFKPYPKQELFFTASAKCSEVMLMAGNQQGKTEAGAFAVTCHLTGKYPAGWTGRRWDRPIRAWACGEGAIVVRDVQQRKLCGTPGVEADLGTGFIPKELFADRPSMARGVTDAFDTILVKHISGGVSSLTFKSYEQGRVKHQGEPVDLIWDDEECPMDIYTEHIARTTATNGLILSTFTPLKGRTDLVNRFVDEKSPTRTLIQMTMHDALHLTPERITTLLSAYPRHEREARLMGVPMLGSGRVFSSSEEQLLCPTIRDVPPHWYKLWCVDFGINHPFAAVLLLWDKDNDVVYVHHVIRFADGSALNHAVPMKQVAALVPVAWPHDGDNRDKGSGEPLAVIYKSHGLAMRPDRSQFSDGSISTEAGIMAMDERMITGRFKVEAHCLEWFEEYRMYHRKDGQIVKVKDDLMSATRIGIMDLRHARQVPLGPVAAGLNRRRRPQVADGVDFDPFE